MWVTIWVWVWVWVSPCHLEETITITRALLDYNYLAMNISHYGVLTTDLKLTQPYHLLSTQCLRSSATLTTTAPTPQSIYTLQRPPRVYLTTTTMKERRSSCNSSKYQCSLLPDAHYRRQNPQAKSTTLERRGARQHTGTHPLCTGCQSRASRIRKNHSNWDLAFTMYVLTTQNTEAG